MLTINRLAKLLAAFADENGVPNGISPGELCDGRDIRPIDVGRLVVRQRDDVNAVLKPRGYAIVGYADAGEGYGKRIELDVCT